MRSSRVLLFLMTCSAFAFNPAQSQAQVQSAIITTYAGPPMPAAGTSAITQAIDNPTSVVPDGSGGFYVVSQNQNRVYKVSSAGTLTVVAGTSAYGFSGDGGPAIMAQLSSPYAIAIDGSGNLYISDTNNNRIRKVTTDGLITTVAGTMQGFAGDGGPATLAQLNAPKGIAVDSAGNLYVADAGNNRVRKVDATGQISTVVDSSVLPLSPSPSITGVAIDPAGNLYIASGAISKRTTDGRVSLVVGPQTIMVGIGGRLCIFMGDGGPAISASVCNANGVWLDSAGNLYIADTGNQRIRKVTVGGIITTVAGNGQSGAVKDNVPAVSTPLGSASGVGVDSLGNIYIAVSGGNRVSRVTNDGIIHTVAGSSTNGFSGDGGPATVSQLYQPDGVLLDGQGNLYIADAVNNRVRKITANGIISTFAGTGVAACGSGGPAISAQLDRPTALALDSAGNIYIASGCGINKVDTDGNLLPPVWEISGPSNIAIDASGGIYMGGFNLIQKNSAGVVTTVAGTGLGGFSGDGGPAVRAQVNEPTRLTFDASGDLYFADTYRVRKITPDGIITTVAGNGISGFSGDGGPATAAQLTLPSGLALDNAGNLYVGDYHRIRKVSPDGIITTIAGNGVAGFSGDGGPATSAQLEVEDIVVDATGSLLVADASNSRIRKISFYSNQKPYSIPAAGATYWSTTTTPASGPITIGYGSIAADSGSSPASGVAMFSYRSNGILVTETSVAASPLIQSGRIYAENGTTVRTGLAIANPNSQAATLSFYFTDKDGVNFNTGSVTITANQQIAVFLDEPPFNGNADARSFTFNSSLPVGAVALRGHINERSEFLMTTLPVAPIAVTQGPSLVLPHFAAGGGWTTQVLLVNPTDSVVSGTVTMDASYKYSISPRSAVSVTTTVTTPSTIRTGYVQITPDSNSPAPVASCIFSFVSGGITVTESGIAGAEMARSFRIYAETDFTNGMETGIAIANTGSTPAQVQFELLDLNGQSTGYSGSTTIDSDGHLALFLNQLSGFRNVPATFRGILRVSSDSTISAIGLREGYNERGDFLISTTPAIPDTATTSSSPLLFPHIVAGDGYTTEFILLGAASSAGPAAGSVTIKSQTGTNWPLQLN